MKFLKYATARMDLENTFNETSQAQKDGYHVILLEWQIPGERKQVPRGQDNRVRSYCLMDTEFMLGMMQVLRTDQDYTTL